MIRATRTSPPQPLALPGWKTASGGSRPIRHRHLSRWRSQAHDASGKMRPGYGGARRCSHLPQKQKSFTCADAMNEGGRIKTKTLGVSGVLGIGMVGATGTWVNQQTGTHGTFKTFGFGAGIAAGGTLTAPSYSSIGAFTGMSDGYSIGASLGVGGGRLGIGGGYTSSWNDSGSGGGATFDVGSAQLPSFSFAGTWTDTQISNCQRGN